jgi:S1-C subfamily serine protease
VIPAEHPSAAVLGEERLGSAVAVSEASVLTAHYLVLGASEVQVAAADGRTRTVTRIGIDHESGLGLLTLEGPALRPVRLEGAATAAPGLPVFLLTCTSAEERKGATGHVSVVGPFEAFWEYMLDRAIMTTVVNPGLAGAPLFDIDGRLLGIVSLGLSAVGRYSLAVPADLYLTRRSQLEGRREPGRPRRAWIGFYPHTFDGGVIVTGVVPGGPADKAGVAQGDLVLSVEGKSISTLRELYSEMWRKRPGDTLSFQLLRDSKIRIVEIVAGDRYDFYK